MKFRKLLSGMISCALLTLPVSAQASGAIGEDASACNGGGGPAIQVNVTGLKDRSGRLKLELYPANDADFLKDDRDLKKEGKFFRRIWADTPASGNISLCIKAPRAGSYALFFTHDRDGANKFNFWQDGAGTPSNQRLGRSKPKLAMAQLNVGGGVTTTTIRAQYLRGVSGFGPLAS